MVTAIVAAALLLSLWRQWVPMGARGILPDQLGLVPQWRFFAQQSIARPDCFDDHHLLARISDANGEPGPWQPVFHYGERHWSEALWNPDMRPRGMIGETLGDLCAAGSRTGEARFLSSRIYLTLLSHCLGEIDLQEGESLQFAVVATRGRTDRALFVRFLSAWHRP